MSDRLNPGEQLNPGDFLWSADPGYALTMQGDGNLVLYHPGNLAIWSSNTFHPGSVAVMQNDGNLVVIAPGTVPVWASGTGSPDSVAIVQTDGNFVIYAPGNQPVWATRTNQEIIMAQINHVVVNPAEPSWHAGFGLAANQDYLIKPRPNSIYTINGGITEENFHGSAWTDGNAIGVGQIRLGGLAVLVWHHQPDGSAVSEIILFPPGKNYAYANIGAQGGSMHFLIGDVPGTYADNSGICEVDVIQDDESEMIRPAFPIVIDDGHVHNGYAKWTVGDTGFVLAFLKGTHSGISGSARFSTRLILTNKFGSPIYASEERAMNVGAVVPSGTNTKQRDWSDFPPVPPEILKSARGGIVQLERNAGDGDLITQLEHLGRDFKRLDRVYQTFKDSEIIKDIGLAVAAG